jgi:hypothetical protein
MADVRDTKVNPLTSNSYVQELICSGLRLLYSHTTMFNQKLNSGYWTLGKESARLISGWLEESHQYRCSKSKPNQEEEGHGSDKKPSSSTYFTDQDVEYHDQLSQDAKGKLGHEIGDQMRKDEL